MKNERPSASPWLQVAADGRSLKLEDFLSFRLSRLSTLVQREVTSKYLETEGLSLPDWRVLASLAQHGRLETRELAQRILMDKAAISRALDSLVLQGLASRTPDPHHAQRRIVSITKEGGRMVRRIMPKAQRAHASLLLHLSSRERRVLDQAITKLAQALNPPEPAKPLKTRARMLVNSSLNFPATVSRSS